MPKDLFDIAMVIAGPITTRTLENLRRSLEDLYVKSTAQGNTPEDQALFTPALIAQAHDAARLDNARTIVSWAQAIYDCLHAQEQPTTLDLSKRLIQARDKEFHFERMLADIQEGRTFATLPAEERERQAEGTQRALQDAQADVARLTRSLRDLQDSATPVLGHPPYQGPIGSEPVGHINLDGDLSALPHEDP